MRILNLLETWMELKNPPPIIKEEIKDRKKKNMEKLRSFLLAHEICGDVPLTENTDCLWNLTEALGTDILGLKMLSVYDDRKAKLRKGNSPQNPKGPFSTIKKGLNDVLVHQYFYTSQGSVYQKTKSKSYKKITELKLMGGGESKSSFRFSRRRKKVCSKKKVKKKRSPRRRKTNQ